MNSVCFADTPRQGIPMGRADVSDTRWSYSFVLQSLGPGTSRTDSLADRRKRDGVYG